jgi:hypothetical protein
MIRHLAIVLALWVLTSATIARASTDYPVVFCDEPEESSWIFHASYFSHDPQSGERVAQYAESPTSYLRDDPTYLESGYVHNQDFIFGADGSANRMHVVQTWGKGELIRPYGEWAFPYRAGATPYGPWGNPQGPWTMPFDSWQNPYGLMQHLPNQSWPGGPYQYGTGYGQGYGPGSGPGPGYGQGQGPGYGPGIMPYSPPSPPGPGNY